MDGGEVGLPACSPRGSTPLRLHTPALMASGGKGVPPREGQRVGKGRAVLKGSWPFDNRPIQS